MARCENSGGAQLKHKPFWTLKAAAGGWHGPYIGREVLENMYHYHQLTNIVEWYMFFFWNGKFQTIFTFGCFVRLDWHAEVLEKSLKSNHQNPSGCSSRFKGISFPLIQW